MLLNADKGYEVILVPSSGKHVNTRLMGVHCVTTLSAGLPRLGICKNMKREVMYVHMKYQGLGVKNLYDIQGIKHIIQIVDDCENKTI